MGIVEAAMTWYAYSWAWQLHEVVCAFLENTLVPAGESTPAPVPLAVIELILEGVQRDSSPRTLEALAVRQMSPPVLEARISALVAIMQSPGNLERVGAAKGEGALLAALAAHGANPRVCAQACLALSAMSQRAQGRANVRRQHGVGAVLKAFDAHRAGPEVQTHALALLAALVEGSRSMQAAFRKAHGPALLDSARHPALGRENTRVAAGILRECAR